MTIKLLKIFIQGPPKAISQFGKRRCRGSEVRAQGTSRRGEEEGGMEVGGLFSWLPPCSHLELARSLPQSHSSWHGPPLHIILIGEWYLLPLGFLRCQGGQSGRCSLLLVPQTLLTPLETVPLLHSLQTIQLNAPSISCLDLTHISKHLI